MIRNRLNALALGSALLALGIAGCGSKTSPAPGGTAAPGGNSSEAAQVPPDVTGAALRTRVGAKPFQVDLRSDGALKKGENTLIATVTKNGKPVTDANVTVLLTMASMKMYGAEVTLEHTEGGRYRGTGNLAMAGDWQANVTVSSGPDTGKAVYDFRVEAPAGS